MTFCYHLTKFECHRNCHGEDRIILVCHMISEDHVIKDSCDFIGVGLPSKLPSCQVCSPQVHQQWRYNDFCLSVYQSYVIFVCHMTGLVIKMLRDFMAGRLSMQVAILRSLWSQAGCQWRYGWEPIMISYHPFKFSGYKHWDSGDIVFLVVGGHDSTCPYFSSPLLFICKVYGCQCLNTQNFTTQTR